MNNQPLAQAVAHLAHLSHAFTDTDCDQPWQWGPHNEGIRFALLGTYHELQDLAVALAQARIRLGPPVTRSHRALAAYHAAYRDLEAVLSGMNEASFNQEPSPGEWSVRHVLGHIVGAERAFFTLVHYGLMRQRTEETLPARLPDGEVDRVMGPRQPYVDLMEGGDPGKIQAFYSQLHQRALTEFADISDAEIKGPSVWWEEEAYSLQYRMHRFDAHLRQHTIQIEKTLAAIGQPVTEAKGLLRLVYHALSHVEAALIGAPYLGEKQCIELAETIRERADSAAERVKTARELITAVTNNDPGAVAQCLQATPELVQAVNHDGLPLIMAAIYGRQTAIVAAFLTAGAELTIFEAAALGKLDVVEKEVGRWQGFVNEYGRDGFTPLQLACFFGQETVALWLIDQEADVNAHAKNNVRVAPIHAAAASGNHIILTKLLKKKADVNARQAGGFTPLHTAADHNDIIMARLLLQHGADIESVNDRGQSALGLALAKGHNEMVEFLRQQGATSPEMA